MRLGCIAVLLTSATLLGVAVWGCFGVTHHLIVAIDHAGDAAAGVTQTVAKLNGPHGTIAMADEDAGAAKSLIVHADMAARHEQQQLTTWDTRGDILFANINDGVTDLRGTINASTKTVDAGTALVLELRKTAQAVNDPKKGLPPILAETGASVKDAHTALPQLTRAITATADTAENTRGITEHVDGITGDLQVALHPILNPDPCTTRGCKIKRALGLVKAAGSGSEGLYYLIEVAKIIF
jgi:hypothetical protein